MRIWKMALVVVVAMGLVAGMNLSSYAAPVNYTCTVSYAGPATSGSYYRTSIRLTWVSGAPEPADANKVKVFYAPTGHEKEFLATALTAMTNGKKVTAYVDFSTADQTLYNLFMMPN